MSGVAIIIPSAGRADAVLTRVAGAALYVPESEAAAYRRHNPGTEVLTHPDAAYPNLAAKRQAIYARWGRVCMLDDDIEAVWRLYLPGNQRHDPLTPDEARDLIEATACAAQRAGCYLWGWNPSRAASHYYPGRPIHLTGYINASAIGLHPSPRLYFSPRTTAAESHWINLLNAAVHRRAWRDDRFVFAQLQDSTGTRPGGQTAHRTLASERADTLFLRRMFGQAVQLKRTHPGHGNVHPYQRTLRNPL